MATFLLKVQAWEKVKHCVWGVGDPYPPRSPCTPCSPCIRCSPYTIHTLLPWLPSLHPGNPTPLTSIWPLASWPSGSCPPQFPLAPRFFLSPCPPVPLASSPPVPPFPTALLRLRMQRKEGKKGGLSKKESLLSEDLSQESKVSSSQVSIQDRRKV